MEDRNFWQNEMSTGRQYLCDNSEHVYSACYRFEALLIFGKVRMTGIIN